MGRKSSPYIQGVLSVPRSKEEARQFYDRISRVYDYFIGVFERKHAEMALAGLSIEQGEKVLEIDFGTGRNLKRIAEAVGKTGKACGIDISSGMLDVTRKRLGKAGLLDRTELHCGDAINLPYGDNTFDAVFMSYTLELFDTPEIPRLLEEIERVLKPAGRLGMVSMSKEKESSMMLRFYEWAHQKWPKYIDCRPIYAEKSFRDAGYKIKSKERIRLFGLPGEIVIAEKQLNFKY